MGADLRPVEAAPAGHQDEDVVVVAAPDDDRAQERRELDALELGALLGAVGALGPDDIEGDPGPLGRLDRRCRVGHVRSRHARGSPEPASAATSVASETPSFRPWSLSGKARMSLRSKPWSCTRSLSVRTAAIIASRRAWVPTV